MNRTLSIWLLSLMALAGTAAAQSLDLTRSRLSGGGGASTGGQFTLFSTVGQAEAGPKLLGGSYAIDTAFLSAAIDSSIPIVVFAQGVVTVTEDAGAQTRAAFTTFLPGQAGEPAQPPTYQLANNNAALFSTAPAMATDRTLSFTPALNASGSATVTVVARLSGVDVATNSFSIVVLPVNDAPVVTLAGNVTVLEDAGAQSLAAFATFTPGPADESIQTPAYTLTTDNAALFTTAPAIAVDGTLTFTAAANANGSATVTVVTSDGGGTANGGVDRATNTFTLTVTAVNDPPAATYAMSTVTVFEDAGAQTLAAFATFTAGPADESAQTASYTLAVDNAALFSTAPAIAPNGTLTFTSAANANGSATVTVIVADSGGAANGGVDRSTNTFAITVTPVNDAPAVTYAMNNVVVLEDAGGQTLTSFATFTAGPADESAQTASYSLTANNAALFSVPPAIAPNGTLTFTPAANANGSATMTVIVADNGGTANNGADRSTNSFIITVTPVNDPPVVTLALGTVTVLEDAGAQSLGAFASFSTGPADEAAQALVGYTVANNNASLFATPPALALNGTLTFTPAAHANGSATITVIAQDSGGTVNNGVDQTTNTFTISVTAVNDAPTMAFATNHVVTPKDAGAQTVTGFALFTAGPADEAAQTAAYTVTTDNAALFSAAPAIAPDGSLTYTTAPAAEGMAAVTVVVQDNGGTANGGADKATNTFNLTVLSFAAAEDIYTVVEDGSLVVPAGSGVLANDIGTTLRALLVTTTTHGVLALNLNGSFTYQPAADFNGPDTFTYQATNSANTSAVTTVTLMVKPVNDAPSVTFAQSTVTVLEDAGAQSVSSFATFSPGPASESAQTLAGYAVTVDNPSLFTTPPAINQAGVLAFTPAPDANGSAVVTVVAQDSGGTTDSGVDKSTNTFTISVTPVNDAPTFTLAQNTVTVLEDAGAQTVSAFATFSSGPANESAQTLVGYAVSVNNASLFSAVPVLNNAGVLTFTPAVNANGTATVTVVAQDSGGTAGGGVDKATNTFTINVTAVNDAPSVTLAQSVVTVLEDAGAQSVSSFATFSPGPANESAQTLVGYTVTVDNAGLFSTAPAIDTNGRLTFTVAANSNGTATVTVVVQDNGGTGLAPTGVLPTTPSAVDKATNTFTLNVTAVNDAPSVTFAQGTVTVLEDAGAQSFTGFATFSAGPVNESVQTLVGYTVTVDNAGLFSAVPAIDTNGRLTFTPTANSNGTATVTVVVQDSGGTGLAPTGVLPTTPSAADKSTNTFTINVTAVNDAPSVTFAQGTVTVLEDAGAQALAGFATFSPGPANESAQTLVGYTVTVDNAGLFSAAPAIDTNGRLTFTPTANSNGTAAVTVVVQDNGGVADSGVDKATNTFTISVTPVNDAPTVTLAHSMVTVLEDAGAQAANGFATFSSGPANESAQTLVGYTVTVDNAALFSAAPAINTSGGLTFTPAANSNGSAIVTVVAQDSGGTAGGGLDKATNTFTIQVTAVNDAPSVTFAQSTVTVLEDAGAQSLNTFATFSPGPANESAQTLVGYTVTVDNGALFSAAPAVANNGTLTFTPAANANGSAAVTVVLQDSGGTTDGGVDRSTNTFTISVTSVNDAPSVTFAQSVVTVLEDAGAQTVAGFATFSPGPANESSQTLAGYTVTANNAALFSSAPAINHAGVLTFTAAPDANGSATVTVVVQDSGGTGLAPATVSVSPSAVDKATNTFTINVTPVNDAPGMTFAQSTVTVLEDAGAQSMAFATLSPGPANESAQTLVGYTVTVDNAALFTSLPAINNAGVLTFTSAPDVNGSAMVTVVAQDSGGTGLAPTDTAATPAGMDKRTNTFTISVTPVNDAPSVTFAQSVVTVLEDAGAQSVAGFATFSPGPANESAQTLAGYTVTVNNAALFGTAPAIDSSGRLTFTSAPDANGSAVVTVVVQDSGGTGLQASALKLPAQAGGVDKSTNTFTVSVTPVNDAPAVAFAQSVLTVLEDAGVQSFDGFATFSSGPANESGQVLETGYQVSNNNLSLFSIQPVLAPDGRLTFTPAANANGLAVVTVIAQDTGGLANGGVDKTTNTFTISVTAVNDAPMVTFAQSTVTVLEDAGAQSVAGFATFSPGPANESAQTLVGYTVTVDNAALFLAAPTIDTNGRLTFTPATNANGSATVTVVVQDSGGTGLAPTQNATPPVGVDKATNTFTISVTPVNDAPGVVFAQGTVTVLEDAGAQSLAGFAAFSAGPTNEAAQTLVGYTVTVDNAALFAASPAINNAGGLTFTPVPDANGSATVTVVVHDSGGTADGGADKRTNTFTINVTAVNDAPGVTFVQSALTVLEDAGAQTVSGFATFSAGPLNESAQVLVHQVTVDNSALFSVAPAISETGVLTFTPATNANGSATVTVVVLDSGGSALAQLITDVFQIGGVTLFPGAAPFSGPFSAFPGSPLIGGPAAGQLPPGPLGVDRSTNTFIITVTPVNDAPSVTFSRSLVAVQESAGPQSLAGFATFSPGPANESAQSLVGYTVTVDNATLFSAAPVIDNSGRLTFTAALNSNGLATVTVVVQDNGGTGLTPTGAGPGPLGVDKSTNTFVLTVGAVNNAPIANHDSYTMNQGDVLTINGPGVLANDTDVEFDALTATKLTDPAHGTVTLNANGGFNYTPDTNFFGPDTFTYRASDYGSNSNPATVSLLVYARPTNAVPPLQRVFSSTVLRFSVTNMPDANALRVGDPDSTVLTVSLAVTNGTLSLTVTNGLDLPNGFAGSNALVLAGTIADLNAALESLAYRSTTNYFGDDALVIVSTDEGGRTNRGGGVVPILVEIPTLGGVPRVSLENLNDPMTGRMITNVTMVASDTNLVKEITFNPTNSEVNVLAVGGQDGSTNRSAITVTVEFNDGTTQLVTIPVIIYQPLLTSVSGDAAYTSTFGAPIFNPQTSLYEQKVSVVNHTPFDFTALRITATNLPAGVTLRNASVTNGGLPYIEYNLAVRSGSNITLTLEYYNVNRASGISPGLKLELLNQTRVVPPPSNPVMVAVTGRRGYAPDGRIRFYIEFPTEVGLTYYVQYQDAVGDPWKTSPVIIPGTGNRLNWLDDGAPNTDSPPTATRFYRIVTGN